MSKHRKEILVYADWDGLPKATLMGSLSADFLRGNEVFAFSYDDDWLVSGFVQSLDPDLGLYTGPQYVADSKKNLFGLFGDSAPDRWGRLLMRRKEELVARAEQRAVELLRESDYLLGVYDEQRAGGLRFRQHAEGEFLNNDKNLAVPPWTALRSLEEASRAVEQDTGSEDPRLSFWLDLLLAPGSSLGGARPKAGVVDPQGRLWIAKFPSRNDDTDSGAWEMLSSLLAKQAGIVVSQCKATNFAGKQHTFLTRRFDRTAQRRRIHYASALTMLGLTDGAGADSGVGYLDMAAFLVRSGANVDSDLEQLWRRIVFSICIANTDDHLRNHGFLLTPDGWVLSPAFDMNPNRFGRRLSLNISENDSSLDLDLALGQCDYFRLSRVRAEAILRDVVNVVATWRDVAAQLGICRREIEEMAPAFAQTVL